MSIFSRVDCYKWNTISALRFYCIEELLGDSCFRSDSSVHSFAYCETQLLHFIHFFESLSFFVEAILAFFANP